MKTRKLLAAIILTATLASCGGKQQSPNDIITVDVNASYPEKELILQDFMNVEYIPLETTDEFITQGVVKAIGKKHIVAINWINDGDIFIFDRNGKGLRKINRRGQSGEEYSMIADIILDEDNNELFVLNNIAKKILVYDLNGKFKRSFKFADRSNYTNTFNYDSENLICHKGYLPMMETEQSAHIIISKYDGSITKEIEIPYERIQSTTIDFKDGRHVRPNNYLTIPFNNNWVIYRSSSDTIYNHSLDDNTITPLLVRTPSIHSMNPQVFLFPTAITDRYYFMNVTKKEFNPEIAGGFPRTDLVYDKKEKKLFKYTLYNNDYRNKKEVHFFSKPANNKILTCQLLNAANLVDAYENGELKGKLKAIVAELDEEDNPVIMIIKHK